MLGLQFTQQEVTAGRLSYSNTDSEQSTAARVNAFQRQCSGHISPMLFSSRRTDALMLLTPDGCRRVHVQSAAAAAAAAALAVGISLHSASRPANASRDTHEACSVSVAVGASRVFCVRSDAAWHTVADL